MKIIFNKLKRILRYIKIILKVCFVDFEHSFAWKEAWNRSERK